MCSHKKPDTSSNLRGDDVADVLRILATQDLEGHSHASQHRLRSSYVKAGPTTVAGVDGGIDLDGQQAPAPTDLTNMRQVWIQGPTEAMVLWGKMLISGAGC